MEDQKTPQYVEWLSIKPGSEPGLFLHNFAEHHIGNPFIRSLHGGVTGAITEYCAEQVVFQELGSEVSCKLTSNSMNYLRVTKAENIFARAKITRISRRMAFVDVVCWQDDESIPVTQGQCTIRIFRSE
ncbi:MAG: PaaI family thioesterase [Rhizobiaceae bacterium]|nr:PaaI family thioesterase [Rhizobiaceae bacterium]